MGTVVLGALGGRTSRLLVVAVLVVVMAALLPPVAGTASSAGDGRVSVIVQARPRAAASAARLVEQVGGQVGRQLRVINGFTALVPAGQVDRLQGSPAVGSVTPDEPVQMQAAAYTPTTDAGSLYTTTLQTGARAYWKAGYTGKGVDVAVIDTGAAPVPGLDGAGKVVNGPDLSFESQAPTCATWTPTATAPTWPGSSPAAAPARWPAAMPATPPTSSAWPPTPASSA
jgi:serine protease AprX